MNFKELTNINFELNNTLTWGVKKDKYGGYSVPIVLDSDAKTKIESLAEEHNTKNPVYKTTLYLKSKGLSEKQMIELFDKDRSNVLVHFKLTGIYTNNNNTSYLVFKITKLRKLFGGPEPEDFLID